ncbi:Pyruvate, water dikinase [[Leptolyngbya] sp. PCC 7376]|uniref:PEP/pyruvate-binding domain-containing protein n=1 Tax=[Leptolyngbya] sp. PCC 7376 TaxID=111781 RepID=UPI00029EEBB2|nr:PEP/pyruvate-binding domain-containing protein [[Leptolyngbya] sp. PCC 7376]AFY38427.1 Pyruvate, water dikinase [[Leptolyngbya] sp. PCC 7376]
MTKIIWLQDIEEHQNEVGGKAKAIAQLLQAGFSVPNGFVVTDLSFDIELKQLVTINSTIQKEKDGVICKLRAEDKLFLEKAFHKLESNNKFVAIRSSATSEDGQLLSFAGQFKSFLNVSSQNIEDAVIEVWKSAQNKSVSSYQKAQKIQSSSQSMAILIQPMIVAELAGVAFSVDPISGQRNVVINVVEGLGDRLMSGEVTGQSYTVNRFGQVTSRSAEDAILSDEQLLRITELVRQVERYFGQPQDIEWAIADNKLYLLQARPITTLKDLPDPDGVFQLWDNSNIVESYSGVTTPLTFSFARKAYTKVYQQFCRFMGVSKPQVLQNQAIFRNMIGFIQGRIYYNLLNWYRILAMLPAAKINAHFMEQMMGVKEELPEDIIAEIQASTQPKNWREDWQARKVIFSLILNFLTLERRIKKYYQRVNEALVLRETETTPSNMNLWRVDELVAYYRSVETNLLAHWDAPLINDFFAMIFYGLLHRLTEKWCGDQTDSLHNALISAEGDVISAEPLILMRKMASELNEEDVKLLAQGNLREIKRWLQTQPNFARQYQAYLEKFGDRCLAELKLESPTLHDQPLLLFRSISQISQVAPVEKESNNQLRQDAEKKAFIALKKKPLKQIIFRWILNNTRRLIRNRENLRFERTRVFGLARRIFMQLGRQLAQVQKLNTAEDIFYLEVEEIMSFFGGTSTCQNLQGLVDLRRVEFQKYKIESAPGDRFSTKGMVYQGNQFQSIQISDFQEMTTFRQGKSCAVGRVKGQVCIVRDPQKFLQQNRQNSDYSYILVAESTDPGWILLFPHAMGLLVERGSVLSHVAIVCRELGLPMITDLSGITQWLNDGDWVEIDGSTGKIYKLETEAIADHTS